MSWAAASFVLLAVALTAGFAWYERSHPTARVIALVATLAALAALGRIAFAPLPNVKPTTDIVLISGYVLGGAPGFAVGAVAALASNLFFGQGPWTPWQMAAWGGVGLAGAGLARVAGRELGRIPLAAACAVASLGFGAVMNLHLWVTYSGDHTAAKLAAIFATSLPFDIAHATGSALFCLAFGPALVHALVALPPPVRGPLGRRRRRPPSVLLALVAVAVAAPAARAQHATDAAAARASVRYLVEAQNDDGGWGGSPDQSSSQLYTGWTAIGLAAAGRNPRDVGSPSAVAYIRDHAGELNDLGEINRTIIVLVAARAGAAPGRPRPGRRAARQAAAQRLLRGPREHDRVRDPRAARGRPRAALARRPPRGRLHRRRGQLRRRLQLRRPGRPVRDRRHQRGAPGAGRRRPAAQRRRQARGRASSSATRPPTAASRWSPAEPRTRSRPRGRSRAWSPPAATRRRSSATARATR